MAESGINKRRYRIRYHSGGLQKGELALDPRYVSHHLRCLPKDLRLQLYGGEIQVMAEPDPADPEAVLVDLVSNDSDHELDDLLANCVRRINARTMGLCFVIERVAAPLD